MSKNTKELAWQQYFISIQQSTENTFFQKYLIWVCFGEFLQQNSCSRMASAILPVVHASEAGE